MNETGMFNFVSPKFDELMIEAAKEVNENEYDVGYIVAGYLASFETALVYSGFNRKSIFPILKETSEKLHILYNIEVKGSDNNE